MIIFFFISGMIFDGEELHYVEPLNGSSLDDDHLILKHADLKINLTCGKLLLLQPITNVLICIT